MFFQNLWTNWSTGVKNIGNFINKNLPSVLKGVKTVASWVEATGLPGVSTAANVIGKAADVVSAIHTYANKGSAVPGNGMQTRPAGASGYGPNRSFLPEQEPLD